MKKLVFPLLVLALFASQQTNTFAVSMTIDSLSGPVTQNEINSFKNYMKAQSPPQTPWGALHGTNGAHNLWADGTGGRQLEAMCQMYEITGDSDILTNMVSWTDICVSQRNDLMSAANGGQRVMWDTNIDMVWCPEEPTSAHAKYAGCEDEDVEGHIAYAAKVIIENPAIWNTTVPDGNPYGYGATYLDRAKTYLAKCDEANDQYVLKWFIQSGTDLIRPPTLSGWTVFSENVTANNRQMMFTSGFQRLAEAHELLGDNPSRVAQYDAIVQASTDEVLGGMIGYPNNPRTAGNGDTIYKWGYYPTSTTGVETTEIHAEYDMLGVWRAFNRATYGYHLSDLVPFANTFADVIYLGTNKFAVNVDGTGGVQGGIFEGWYMTADWNPQVYNVLAPAAITNGWVKSHADNDAAVLFMKDRRYREFSIAANPSSQTVTAGSGTSYTVTLAPLGGFIGSVTLSVSGLPSGVTASFNHSPINLGQLDVCQTNITMTLSTSISTPADIYTITVTGTSGSVSHSDTVTLTVNAAPDFSISATPSSQTTTSGNFTSYTVNSGNTNGFSGSISLSASGLPSGAAASFNPSSINAGDSSTLTVTTSISTPGGTSTVAVKGTSGGLNRTNNVTLIVNSAGGALPSGWTDTDIGSPGWAGSAGYASGVFTLNGGGSDIWGTSDQFNYAYESTSGDLTVVARVASQQNTGSWAKSGVMIRESAAVDSSYVGLYVTPGNGVSIQFRNGSGTSAIDLARQTGVAAPYWVKLVRSGNTFTGYSSSDGTAWTTIGSTNVTMASSVTAGLLVCAHDNTTLNTSTFDNVSVTTPDFSVSATPSSQTVTQGGGTNYTATVSAINGFSGTVTWSVSGLPSGASGNFNPTTINGSGSSTLTVTTSGSTPAGTYPLTITGTSGSLQHSANVTLIVNSAVVNWTTVNDTDSRVTYSAGWNYSTNRNDGDYNNDVHYTKTNGNYAQFTFNGTAVEFITETYSDEGNVDVYIDGAYQTTVNCNTSTRQTQFIAYANTGLSAGTHTIKVVKNGGTFMLLDAFAFGGNTLALTDTDVGAVGIAGSASYANGVYTVTGSGADIWNTGDQFNFDYQNVTNDVTVIARVSSENGTQGYAKAALMIRESLATNSIETSVLLTPTNGVAMELRSTTGAATANITGWVRNVTSPAWLKLTRNGNTFTGYYSADGSTWTQLASTNATMNASTKAGLAVTSHDNTQNNTATFDNVSVQ